MPVIVKALRTGIGRPIDPSYPSNRFVLVATLVAGGIGSIWEVVAAGSFGLGAFFGAGIRAGGTVFIAWAIAREIDPDRQTAAVVAVPIALLALLAGPPWLATIAAVMLAGRVAIRTTGVPPTRIDLLVLVGLAAYLGSAPWGIIGALCIGVALFADTLLPRPAHNLNRAAAIAAVLACVAVTMLIGEWPSWEQPSFGQWTLLGLGVLAAALLPVEEPRSRTDIRDDPLHHGRLRAARLLALITGVAYAGFAGGPGIAGLAAVWAAFIGAALAGLPGARRRR